MITETNYFTKYAKSVVKKYEGMKEEYEFCKAYLTTSGPNPIVRTEVTTNNEKDVWHEMGDLQITSDKKVHMEDGWNMCKTHNEYLAGIDGQHQQPKNYVIDKSTRLIYNNLHFGTIDTLDFTDNKTYKAITIDNIECNIVAEYEKYCWEVEINGKVKVILKSKIALI